MTSKAFSILVLLALVLGVALGGAFAGGFALGKSRGSDQSQASAPLRPTSGIPGGSGGRGAAGVGGREERPPDGSAGRERPSGADGASVGGNSLAETGDSSLAPARGQDFFGSIASFQDGVIALDSPGGQVQAAISESTAIQKTINGSAQDLVVGVEVRIQGRRAEDGPVQARLITLAAEGSAGFSSPPTGGRRGGRGGASLTGAIEGIGEGLVTLATADGTVQVALTDDTAIQRLEAGTGADLVEGARVRMIGSPNGEGGLQATLVILVPEGGDRFSQRGSPE